MWYLKNLTFFQKVEENFLNFWEFAHIALQKFSSMFREIFLNYLKFFQNMRRFARNFPYHGKKIFSNLQWVLFQIFYKFLRNIVKKFFHTFNSFFPNFLEFYIIIREFLLIFSKLLGIFPYYYKEIFPNFWKILHKFKKNSFIFAMKISKWFREFTSKTSLRKSLKYFLQCGFWFTFHWC